MDVRPRLTPDVASWVRQRAQENDRSIEEQVDLMLRAAMQLKGAKLVTETRLVK